MRNRTSRYIAPSLQLDTSWKELYKSVAAMNLESKPMYYLHPELNDRLLVTIRVEDGEIFNDFIEEVRTLPIYLFDKIVRGDFDVCVLTLKVPEWCDLDRFRHGCYSKVFSIEIKKQAYVNYPREYRVLIKDKKLIKEVAQEYNVEEHWVQELDNIPNPEEEIYYA
jgi:hypothetical protein